MAQAEFSAMFLEAFCFLTLQAMVGLSRPSGKYERTRPFRSR